jgi:hypothetical protein
MAIIYDLLQPFVAQPERILTVSVVLLIAIGCCYFVKRRVPWPLVAAAVGWLLFSPWEYYCTVHKYNIRVDLLLIAPLLIVITIWGLAALVWTLFVPSARS